VETEIIQTFFMLQPNKLSMNVLEIIKTLYFSIWTTFAKYCEK